MSAIGRVYAAVGSETRTFDCCDTTFEVHAEGVRAGRGVDRAVRVARDLERQLNAFDPDSDVAALARDGEVTNEHVAAVVRRARAYEDRTDGVFSVRYGTTERRVKTYIREGGSRPDWQTDDDPAEVTVDGETVTSTRPLDLNGIAKGYLVDRTYEALDGPGRRGYVNGGGDIAGPTGGGVAIESPWGGDPLCVLTTDWAVATSGSYRRERNGVDHIYRPTEGEVGARSTLVTVVARRDCTEADVLATTCAALHPDDAVSLVEDWPGAEAFLVHSGVFYRTEGFDAHVA
ncbi:MAG: FAD:protein FMN transferase [Haloplanus sp.]